MSENPVPQEQGATTLDFTGITIIGFSGSSGIQRINGDPAPLQSLTSADSSIIVTDTPAVHDLGVRAIIQTQATGVIPFTVPLGVETLVLSDIINNGNPGFYLLSAAISQAGPLPGTILVQTRLYNGAAIVGEDIRTVGIGVHINGFAMTMHSYLVFYGGGETISLTIEQDSGGTFDINAVLNATRIGR
jgi:hypothetical protein